MIVQVCAQGVSGAEYLATLTARIGQTLHVRLNVVTQGLPVVSCCGLAAPLASPDAVDFLRQLLDLCCHLGHVRDWNLFSPPGYRRLYISQGALLFFHRWFKFVNYGFIVLVIDEGIHC